MGGRVAHLVPCRLEHGLVPLAQAVLTGHLLVLLVVEGRAGQGKEWSDDSRLGLSAHSGFCTYRWVAVEDVVVALVGRAGPDVRRVEAALQQGGMEDEQAERSERLVLYSWLGRRVCVDVWCLCLTCRTKAR